MRRYLRKFRKQSPKGEMSREQFTPIFETSYPTAGNPSAFVDAFFGHWLPEAQKDLMDFKARKEGRKEGNRGIRQRCAADSRNLSLRFRFSFFFPKDFVVAMDVINAKTVSDKLKWAFLVFDPKRKGHIEAGFPMFPYPTVYVDIIFIQSLSFRESLKLKF